MPVRGMIIESLAVCGDGVLDIGEECDDGNSLNGDTCTASCQLCKNGDCSVLDAAADLDGDGILNALDFDIDGDGEMQGFELADMNGDQIVDGLQ
ncbi:MAG: hypothetical protein H6765_10095 [Candidatus Peribacteria bacterium]|nr:MAG: hypothetical protein H6765_10095 [Candidatus Peribacteria bacterium]